MSTETPIGSGLSAQELSLASWWVRHIIALRKLGYAILIIFSSVCWLYALWVAVDTSIISYPREQRILTIIATNSITQQTLIDGMPKTLSASQPRSFETTGDRRDYIVQLSNANPLWWAEFTYRFDTENGTTPNHKGFILPNTQTYLTEIGAKAGRSPQFRMDDIQWHRIYPDEVEKDYSAFEAKRLQIQAKDITYNRNISFSGKTIGQSSFTLVNGSAYGYWSMNLMILLYNQSGLAGITTLNLRELKPGEKRPITINWFDNLDNIVRTEILPSVNILDPSIFLPSTRF